MRNIQKIGPTVVLILALIPVVIWYPYSSWNNPTEILLSLGQVTALTGVVLFSINFILSARFRFIENLFFGLNRVFIQHHLIGAYAFILLLFHPTFILLSYLTISLKAAATLLIPSLDNLSNTLGLSAILTMTVLLVITFYIKIRYESWKTTHQYLGLALVLAFLHVLITPSTISTNIPLRYYILTMVILGILSFTYRILVKYFRFTSLPYLIREVNIKRDLIEIIMDPVGKPLVFTPGQFIFITIDKIGIRRESHPFSITSSLTDKHLSVVCKSVGIYTETLKLAIPGSPINVEGPYGRFSYDYFKNKKQIWIAGGIGITPFLSMLKNVPNDISVNFYHSVKEQNEAVFLEKIYNLVKNNPNIKFKLHVSNVNGYLDAKKLALEINEIGEYEIFICGPLPMMNSLKKQFIDLGVPASHIHTEEFALS